MELLIALAIATFMIASFVLMLKDTIIDNCTYDNTPLICIILVLNVVVVICLILSLKKPRAIDVYRDRTTLEITYKDSVPLDSVVVWKDNK